MHPKDGTGLLSLSLYSITREFTLATHNEVLYDGIQPQTGDTLVI